MTISAPREANRVPSLVGVSNTDGVTPTVVYVDPTTHRLLVNTTGSNFSDGETPSGAINSSNVTFTLAHTPSPAASLQLYANGQLQSPAGVDFTLVTATITMNIAPPTGSTLICWYRY